MDRIAPTAGTLYNYDTDRDNDAGLRLKRTEKGLAETKTEKFQVWSTGPLSEPLVITGDVYITFYAAIKKFELKENGKLHVYIRDHDGLGGYTEIANGTVVGYGWQKGTSNFIQKTVSKPAKVGHIGSREIRGWMEVW